MLVGMSMPTPTPTRKRTMKSCRVEVTKAEAIANTTKKNRLTTKIARRPSRSDMSPKTSSPIIAPMKVDAPSSPTAEGERWNCGRR